MQTETTQRKLIWWGVNILVLLYAFIPVIWIVSLSLKAAATRYRVSQNDRRHP